MKQWEKDKEWSDKFMPDIKAILGQLLIGEISEEDMERNTDLIVLRLDSVRIACRVRSPGYYENFWDEFTIRSSRPSGAKTELTKIVEGWGDYYFYAHSTEDEKSLRAWGLGDLKAFRIYFARAMHGRRGKMPGSCHQNNDGTAFRSFKWRAVPNFVIAESGVTTKCEQSA